MMYRGPSCIQEAKCEERWKTFRVYRRRHGFEPWGYGCEGGHLWTDQEEKDRWKKREVPSSDTAASI